MLIFKSGDKATQPFKVMILTGIGVIAARLLIEMGSFHSGLLYIALPFSLSLALYYLTPHTDGTTWKKRFWNNLRRHMIILFSISLMLMEGYVCVIMFMPLFFLFTCVAFLADYIRHRAGKGSLHVHVLPVIVVLMSLEGTTAGTTFNRYNEVTYSRIVHTDVETIRQRLTQPLHLDGDRHWILSVFPMPRYVGTVMLNAGDIRRYDFVYHRWFFTNTHAGSTYVTFAEVERNRIRTTIEDHSYISGYMKLHGTELRLETIDNTRTNVTLTITFDRLLDPIWYFEPLERFAVKKSAEYFVREVLSAGI